MKRLRVPVFAVGLLAALAVAASVQARDKTTPDQPMKPAGQSEPTVAEPSAYLGIGVEALNPALASQLADTLKGGQGVLVSEVAAGSPAEKAGLKAYDIVTQYDNQRVLSPTQLVKLVRHDQPGRSAKLTVIRGGSLTTVEVTLGKQTATTGMRQMAPAQWTWRRPVLRPSTRRQPEREWTSFDSMNLARVGDNRYKAEISYKNDKGEIETHKYEGSLDAIRKDVKTCKDLPRYEQAHLLRAISPQDPYGFPFIGMMPEAGVMWDLQ